MSIAEQNSMDSIKASVVLRVKNEGASIGRVIDLIKEQDFDGDVEIIIIDSGSTDNTIKEAELRNCRIHKIKPEEFTWGYALNRGAELSRGEYVVYISGHCFPRDKFWLGKMISPLKEDKTAAVYSRQIPEKNGDPFEAIELVYLWFPDSENKMKEAGFSNASCAVKRNILEKIKFDETLEYCEDGEWAVRVKNAGWKIKYCPESKVYHSHPMKAEVVYKRWFLRAYSGAKISEKCRDGEIPYLFYKTLKFAFLDLKYLLSAGKYKYIYKIPFYETIRQIAAFNGARAAENKKILKDKLNIQLPSYLKWLTLFVDE